MESEVTRTNHRATSSLTALGCSSEARLIIFFTDLSLLAFSSVLCSCLRYKVYDLPNTLYTKPVWQSVNPRVEESVHFAALGVSREFLNYLLTNALVVDLWGLQGTRFAHSVLLCTLQPDLRRQRERRVGLWSGG